MRIAKLEQFSEQDWRRAFDAYVTANRSHWTGPPYDVVKTKLEKEGVYEFGFQSMGTWASKFRLVVKSGDVHAEFVTNPDLPERMREKLEEMRSIFERELQ